jgi:hypothetical protein
MLVGDYTFTSSYARARTSRLINSFLFQKITHNILNNFLETKYTGSVHGTNYL